MDIICINDSQNKSTQDRESFANSVGSAGSTMGSVNNFFYGNGGLTDSSIANYYNTNQTGIIATNNFIVSTLTPQNRENSTDFDNRYLNLKIIGNNTIKASHSSAVIHSSDKKQLENYLKDNEIQDLLEKNNMTSEDIKINENKQKNRYEVVISFGPESDNLLNPGKLILDTTGTQDFSKGDIACSQGLSSCSGGYTSKPLDNQTKNNEQEVDLFILKSALQINLQKRDYAKIPRPLKLEANSNSAAFSLCRAVGGSMCSFNANNPGSKIQLLPIKPIKK